MRTIDRANFIAGGLLLLIGLAPLCRGAVIQSDISSIRGDQSRQLFGTGAGIIVGIVDGGVDATHPALQGSMLAAKDFSRSRTTSDDANDIGHGTGIMSIVLGHDALNGFTGLAPSAKFVNARVVDKSNNTTDTLIGNGVFWAVGKGAKIVNISLGTADPNPDQNKLSMMLDYATQKYGTLFVVASGNENASAVQGGPAGQYNSFTVGATYGTNYDKVTVFSNYSLAGDLRTKPDLVAPGQGVSLAAANWATTGAGYTDQAQGTSFSAPMVGGILTQMLGYGKAHHLSLDPLVMKAVLMTGTTHVYEYEGGTWASRHQVATASGTTIDQPLDAEQGAGRVDGVAAYDIYAKKIDRTTLVANWTLSSMRENGNYAMRLGNLKAGEEIDTALTWLRHIGRSGGSLSASNKFYQSATLANFSLTLLLNGHKVVTSDSNWDNVDYLSLTAPQNGSYSLLVNRLPGSGLPTESFGLAARVLADQSATSAQPAFARGALPFASAGALRSFDPAVSTPEPGAMVVVIVIGMLAMRRKRSTRDRGPYAHLPDGSALNSRAISAKCEKP